MHKNMSLRQRWALKMFNSLNDLLIEEHPLRSLFWECTLRCNLHCRHCGSDCKTSALQKDMPKEDFLRVIDSLTPHVDPHKVMIIMTGGEALIRRDLEQVGLELYRREYPWGLVTNGMLLDSQRMQSLLASGLHSITLSLDGFAPQHNFMRGNEHSFDRAVDALQQIVKAPNIAYDVVTCVTQYNFSILDQFKQFLIDQGVKAWRLFTVFPVGRGAEDDKLQLSDSEFIDLMEFIKATRKEGLIAASYGCEGFLGSYEGKVRDGFFGCSAGITTAGIRIDGSISGCTSIRADFDQGNIYRDDLWEVWQNRYQPYRDRSWAHKDQCTECKVFKYCHGSGMHLYDSQAKLLVCHYARIQNGLKQK